MNKTKLREENTFIECIQSNINNINEHRSYGTAEYHYLQRGFYYEQIQRFMTHFTTDHSNLPHSNLPQSNLHSNLLIIISEHMRKDPITQYNRVYDFLGVERVYTNIYEEEHIGTYTTTMSKSTEEMLYKLYKPHNDKLFEYLGYTIPEWDANYTPTTTAPTTTATATAATPMPMATIDSGVGATILTADVTTSITTPTVPMVVPIDSGSSSTNTNDSSKQVQVVSASNKLLSDFKFPGCSITDPFYTLGTQHATDKVTHHGYHRFYPIYLAHYQTTMAAAAGKLNTTAATNTTTTAPTTNITNDATIQESTTPTITPTIPVPGNIQGSMLEIGIEQKNSLNLWLDYFPHAYIYGIDIHKQEQGDRYKIIKCDQSDSKMLKGVVKREIEPLHLPMFFILDDGSHIPEHQG